MSRQFLFLVGLLFVTFGFGIALGLFLGGGVSVVGVAEKAKSSASSEVPSSDEQLNDVRGNTLLSSRIRELEAELAEDKSKKEEALADRMAFFEKYHQQIGVQPFDQNMKVTPEMADLLGLSPQQKQAVEQHLAQIKDELEKVEDADTSLTKQSENSVSYEIAADKQGDMLKDQLRGFLAGDMGDEKTKVFMDGRQWPFSLEFAGFMEEKRQIDISWTRQNGSPVYTVTQITANGTSSMTGGLQPEFQKYLPTDAKSP